MRCAIYARFSSDLQDARSITDQVAMCRERAAREGWSVVSEFCDAAISGATLHNRPGLLDLIVAAKEKRFDAVLTESIDRLSRDLEDIAGLHKRLRFWGVKIVTLADGEVGHLQVGLKGLIANLYLEDLAQKTRRGQFGRAREGKIPGGRCYGYRVVAGEERGCREIEPGEAAIVRRIFAEYISGRSPLAIVAGLNREGLKGPRGGPWTASTINGNPKRANGIVANRMYVGELVYNRQRFVKDPATGKRSSKPNPETEWLVHPVPALAIIDAETFAAAQMRRSEVSSGQLPYRRRPKHLLSGLVSCGCCGASMIVVRDDRVGCSALRNRGTCSNRRTIALSEIEQRVLGVLQRHLLSPEIVAASVEAYRAERARLKKGRDKAQRAAMRELAAIDGKIAHIVAAIEDGQGSRILGERLAALEAERALVADREPEPVADDVLELHPMAADLYRRQVAEIRQALAAGDEASHEVLERVRRLIDRIVVTPADDGGPQGLTIEGNLRVMLEQVGNRSAITAVAGSRNQRLS